MNARGPQKRATRQAPRKISPPALIIRLPLEGAPIVELANVECDADVERLGLWCDAHPEYAELWVRAWELRDEARAA